jgi:hypothetical protein
MEPIQDSDREGNSQSLLGRDVNEVDREGIINIKNTLSCLSGILSQGEVGKILPPRSFYVIKENIGCICVSAIYRIANCKDL